MQEDTLFSNITDVPTDPIFGINDRFLKDTRINKINLTVGIFIEEDGKSALRLPSVRLAEEKINQIGDNKNYLPIDGDLEYVELTKKLIFGEGDISNIYGAQTIGGTSALRIIADFVKNEVAEHISIPDPTWENHENVFRRVGITIDKYPYPEGMYDHLSKLPAGTVVLLHAMCHNPTGHDLTKDEWEKLEILFRKHKLIPFFDTAYQGFGTGIQEDALPIRYFVERGHECFVAHSFSKSFSLYGERIGALFIVMKSPELVDRMRRNIRSLIRTTYSNPPRHGAHIVKLVLQTANLRNMWELEVDHARNRMQSLRKIFSQKLREKMPNRTFAYLDEGHGFFCLLGLTNGQIDRLRDEFAIYTAGRSRVNLTALNNKNIDYVVESISKVIV